MKRTEHLVTSSLSQLTQLPQGPGILRLEVYGNAIVPKQKTEKNMSEKFGRGRARDYFANF